MSATLDAAGRAGRPPGVVTGRTPLEVRPAPRPSTTLAARPAPTAIVND
ncbi:hypothetical protein [Streptomyces maremycinicus]|nr:hypothetical protein [Streptomyces sp. NBRC 110468]